MIFDMTPQFWMSNPVMVNPVTVYPTNGTVIVVIVALMDYITYCRRRDIR